MVFFASRHIRALHAHRVFWWAILGCVTALGVTSNRGLIAEVHAQSPSNENWMGAKVWDFIKSRRLDQILIPGTHDTGTAFWEDDVEGRIGFNTARTQTGGFGTQLRDGIRYFDVRVEEAAHTGCADDTVWWLIHGPVRTSVRMQQALDEVKAFLDKPGNEKEILILDFQEINLRYNDARARDNLFEMVQRKLSPHLAEAGWQSKTVEQLVSAGQRVVVLLADGAAGNLAAGYTPFCGNFDKKYFSLRGNGLISAYERDDPLDSAGAVQARHLDAQLNLLAATGSGNAKDLARFQAYKDATIAEKLRVLQVVSRPSPSWYGISATSRAGFPADLLTFVSYRINGRMNYEYDEVRALDWDAFSWSAVPSFRTFLSEAGNCPSGWLGKRLRMSLEGSAENWNPVNIVVVDNYDPVTAQQGTEFDWFLPDYRDGRWVNTGPRSYVDMFVELNKIDTARRLAGPVLLQDGECLSNTYTVGGSVSGLGTGKSVVLQNNAGDDLTVSTNGAFTFITAMASGVAYAVTVKSQPSGQTCAVTNGAGAVGAANVTDVTASCVDSVLAPGAPTGVVATAAVGSASVLFVAPTTTGGGAITGYAVTCVSSDGGAAGTATGTSSPVSVTGLTIGKTYTCTVTATNSAGTGLASPASNSFVPQPPQPIPTLSEWAMIILTALLGVVGFRRLRRV
jgi:hypothetical protein